MNEGTGDRAIRYCFYCRELEHGTAPCPMLRRDLAVMEKSRDGYYDDAEKCRADLVIATRQIAAAQAEAESWHQQMKDREETLLRVGSERDAAWARIAAMKRVIEAARDAVGIDGTGRPCFQPDYKYAPALLDALSALDKMTP